MLKTFESSVNSEYSKTAIDTIRTAGMFESSVNSEYSKTLYSQRNFDYSLRVV